MLFCDGTQTMLSFSFTAMQPPILELLVTQAGCEANMLHVAPPSSEYPLVLTLK